MVQFLFQVRVTCGDCPRLSEIAHFLSTYRYWNSFPRPPTVNCFWSYFRQMFISLAFRKCKKDWNILKDIPVKGFCPLKVGIAQFSTGLRLNSYDTLLRATPIFLSDPIMRTNLPRRTKPKLSASYWNFCFNLRPCWDVAVVPVVAEIQIKGNDKIIY